MDDDQRSRGDRTGAAIEWYADLFAGRTSSMTSSAMRDLMAITEQQDVISLAGGLPDTSTFPPSIFSEVMLDSSKRSLAQILQYGPTEGTSGAREAVAHVMAAEGAQVDPDSVIVTSGGQQGLDLIAKVLVDPGDVIIAEGPTYPGAISAFTSYEARIEHIAVDRDGMVPGLLRERLDDLNREGARPKFIYLIPNYQNPSGVTLSLERRREIMDIARAHEIIIVEDNPYGLVRFEGDPLPTMLELDGGESVVYIGTFSKILSPGIRLGWLIAPRPVLAKINLGKQAADLCASSLGQHLVAEFIRSDGWPRYMDSLRSLYRGRRDAILAALEDHFPASADWTSPMGGLFVWATLPNFIDTTDLLARALRENVAFVPGRAAWVNGNGGSSMRLNFSGADEGHLREGIRRIGAVVEEQVDLYETMTGHKAGPVRDVAGETAQDKGNVVDFSRRRSAGS